MKKSRVIVFMLAAVFCNLQISNAVNYGRSDKLKQELQKIKQSMNDSVNPCSDFFSYVCGNYKMEVYNEDEVIDKEELLNYNFYSGNVLSNSEVKAKIFYESCKRSRDGNQLKESKLYKEFGGWPVLESSWNPRNFNWLKAIEIFKTNGVLLFIVEEYEEMKGKKSLRIFPNLGHLISSSVEDWGVLSYKTMLGFGATSETAKQTLVEVYPFAAKLHNLVYEALFEKHEGTVKISYKLLKEFYKEVEDWDKYLKNVVGLTLNETDNVSIKSKTALKKFLQLLSTTEPKILANYMWLDLLRGATNQNNCERLVERYFQFVYSDFEERPKYNEAKVLKMFKFIRNTFDRLPNNTSIDIKSAKTLLNLWKSFISYRNPGLETEYENLEIIPENFVQNYLNVIRYYSKIAKISSEDTVPSEELSNFYNFIRDPKYNDAFPMSMNFGRFGQSAFYFMIKEPEISDAIQNMKLKSCLRDQNLLKENQYSSTLDELIITPLDWVVKLNLATELAHQTYKNWLHHNKDIERQLKNFENDKMFFISYVSGQCSNSIIKVLVNVNLRNMDSFGEAFHCPVGSVMNPSVKCKIL